MSDWLEMTDQRGPDGLLTPLALALDAIEDSGCDCGEGEEGSCMACLCEAALLDLWEQAEKHAAFPAWLDAEIEAARQLLRNDPIATRRALERVKARLVR